MLIYFRLFLDFPQRKSNSIFSKYFYFLFLICRWLFYVYRWKLLIIFDVFDLLFHIDRDTLFTNILSTIL